MKKILALLLAVMVVMSLAACVSTQNEPTDAPIEPVTEGTTAPVSDGKEMISFSMDINKADGTRAFLYAGSYEGVVTVMMETDIVKRGELDSSAMTAIAKAFENSGLKELEKSPEGIYDGDNASISVSYADETYFSINLYGELPQALLDGYDKMLSCFTEQTAQIPEYVAKPAENGEIADSDRTALDGILANLELPGSADTFAINGIAVDENFIMEMQMKSDEGVASGLKFGPQMNAVAYTLNIVTLEEGADASAVATSFENGINWRAWTCVMPEGAYIATKDNQVLMLLGAEDFYDATITAIETAGWTEYKNLTNPEYLSEDLDGAL